MDHSVERKSHFSPYCLLDSSLLAFFLHLLSEGLIGNEKMKVRGTGMQLKELAVHIVKTSCLGQAKMSARLF